MHFVIDYVESKTTFLQKTERVKIWPQTGHFLTLKFLRCAKLPTRPCSGSSGSYELHTMVAQTGNKCSNWEKERWNLKSSCRQACIPITKNEKNFLQPITFVLYFFQGTFIKEVIYAPFGMRWSPLNLVSCNTTAMTLLAQIINLQNTTFFMASFPMVLTTLLFFHWHQRMLRRCEKESKK